MTTTFDSALLPPADPPQSVPKLTFGDQVLAIIKTIDLLEKVFPDMIARGQITDGATEALKVRLLACAETLYKLANGEDPRPGVAILSGEDAHRVSEKPSDPFAPRAAPRKSPEELHALSAPAAKKDSRKKHERPFVDELPAQLQPISEGFGHDLD